MEQWILLVYTNCTDPSREQEFNDWYDNVHLPDVLETAGFVGSTRYATNNPSADTGNYLATYEIETEDIDRTMVALQEHMRKKTEQGRMSELVQVVSLSVYRHIGAAVRRV